MSSSFPSKSSQTGVLLLNMGGPDALESVKPFLYNLFADPDIIRLPFSGLLQKPLAWSIATRRAHEARQNYRQMGGASPILAYTRQQGDALRDVLAQRGQAVSVYVAMRYWHPFTDEAVRQMRYDRITRLVILPLYPHFSYTTTGSSLNALAQALREKHWTPSQLGVVPAYAQHPGYLAALAECIREALRQHPWSCPPEDVQLLFSAHSLPVKHVARTQDPYPSQIEASIRRLTARHFPKNPWELAYQSRVGSMKWLGPSTEGVLHYFAGQQRDNILIVPISFVSEHVETLVEIDRQFLPEAAEIGIRHCYRTPTFNADPRFIQVLADLVEARLSQPMPNRFPSLTEAIGPSSDGTLPS